MLSKSLKRIHPVFIAVFIAWVSTFSTFFAEGNIFNSLPYVTWEPGLAFALAMALVMKKAWKVPVFVLLSVPIYYVVVAVYMDSVYAGPGLLVVLTVFIIGAILELLVFTILYQLLKQLRWWHFLLAASAGVLALLTLYVKLYLAFAVWYGMMAFAFYTLIRVRDRANI